MRANTSRTEHRGGKIVAERLAQSMRDLATAPTVWLTTKDFQKGLMEAQWLRERRQQLSCKPFQAHHPRTCKSTSRAHSFQAELQATRARQVRAAERKQEAIKECSRPSNNHARTTMSRSSRSWSSMLVSMTPMAMKCSVELTVVVYRYCMARSRRKSPVV